MTTPSQIHLKIFEYVDNEFGGASRVIGQTFDDGATVDVLVVEGSPEIGQRSYSTIGLSDRNLVIAGRDFGFGVELCAGSSLHDDRYELLIGDIAYEILVGNWVAALNTVFPDIFSKAFPESRMRHVLLSHPFSWGEKFGVLKFLGRKVVWLQMIPISESEYLLARSEGVDVLEELLERSEANIFDVNRAPVV